MKILFITVAFAPNEFSESIVNSKLILALKESGHQVDVISREAIGQNYSTSWSEPWLSLQESVYEISYEHGSKLYRFWDTMISSLKFKYPLAGVRWINKAFIKAEELINKNKYDIVISRSPSDIPHIVGLKLKQKYKLPWIANWNDPCNSIMPKPYKNDSNKYVNQISFYYNKKVIANADLNTFPSERLKLYFQNRFNLKNTRTEVIPHIGLKIIDIPDFKYQNNTLKICHAGSLSTERNPELLFKILERIKNENTSSEIELTIIGIADKEILKKIEFYNLQKNVFFVESKLYIDTLKFMQNFDILCIVEAKMEEGIFLPSKLSDYVFLNKPVLCFSPSNGTLNDLINQYGGGIAIDNENEENVYKWLKALSEQKKMNLIQNYYSSDKLARYLSKDNILDLYKSVFNVLCK